MANNKNGNRNNPALNSIKMQAANEVGVPLKDGYNGDLTARQVGSVGGQMVKKMSPVRKMTFTRADRRQDGHIAQYTYIVGIEV